MRATASVLAAADPQALRALRPLALWYVGFHVQGPCPRLPRSVIEKPTHVAAAPHRQDGVRLPGPVAPARSGGGPVVGRRTSRRQKQRAECGPAGVGA